MKKAGKEIDTKNSEITHFRKENAILKVKLAAKEPTGRKTFKFNPNMAFPHIQDIIIARDEAEKQTIRLRKPAAAVLLII
ncbi:hypothetical protein B0J13DRAFT_293036 [Dactylonectria estremocensis]|uniref:Uncharacterized protein n=1 Tax=Dactylonectria estremocensis TaxID=1079267 RepID=A0A9P9D0F4_9HYPO|nr:hypothetical protein B0J13DRAFT_293036 [Dactylonectria estremocensis]